MEFTNEYLIVWKWLYNKVHIFPYEEFLKNLCDFEFDGIIGTKDADLLVKRFQVFKKKKIEDMQLEYDDFSIIQVIYKGQTNVFTENFQTIHIWLN